MDGAADRVFDLVEDYNMHCLPDGRWRLKGMNLDPFAFPGAHGVSK